MHWCFYSPGERSLDVLGGDSRKTGGAEAQIAKLALGLSRQGHRVSLLHGGDTEAATCTTISGVTCINAVPNWRRPRSLLRLWRTLADLTPDVIYARLPDDFLTVLGLYARRHQARFIYAMAHESHFAAWRSFDYNRWFHAPMFAAGIRSAHLIGLQHEGQRALLPPALAARAEVIPNLLLDIAPSVRDPALADYDAIWIAKIRPEKRLQDFIQLASALPDLRFAVAGGFDPAFPPGERLELEKAAAGTGNLVMLGALREADVGMALMRSKVLVNSSSVEGFPNTMLEAWAKGVPVVSLNVDPGSVIERNGLGLVAGTISNLARNVEQLALDTDRNARIGRDALEYVRSNHSLAAVLRCIDLAFASRSLTKDRRA